MEYTNLDIWIECRKLTNIVYDFTKTFPKEEKEASAPRTISPE